MLQAWLCWLVWLCPDGLCCCSQLCILCTHVLLSCRLTVPCPTVLHDTAFFRAFSLMSSCVGIRSLLAYWRFALRSMKELERRCWGGCCVLRCEGRADMCNLFFAGWRMVMAVCRPWFSQLKVRVTLRCLLLVSRAFISRRVFDDRGKYASCFACSHLTHLGVLHLLFLRQFAATFIAYLCAPCILAWGA